MTRDEAIEYLNTLYMALAVFPNQQISLGNVDEMKESVSMAIEALEQELKTGRWKCFIHSAYHGTDENGEPIWRDVKVYHCDKCNRRTVIKENFCPNCGAKMVEPQESEE